MERLTTRFPLFLSASLAKFAPLYLFLYSLSTSLRCESLRWVTIEIIRLSPPFSLLTAWFKCRSSSSTRA